MDLHKLTTLIIKYKRKELINLLNKYAKRPISEEINNEALYRITNRFIEKSIINNKEDRLKELLSLHPHKEIILSHFCPKQFSVTSTDDEFTATAKSKVAFDEEFTAKSKANFNQDGKDTANLNQNPNNLSKHKDTIITFSYATMAVLSILLIIKTIKEM